MCLSAKQALGRDRHMLWRDPNSCHYSIRKISVQSNSHGYTVPAIAVLDLMILCRSLTPNRPNQLIIATSQAKPAN